MFIGARVRGWTLNGNMEYKGYTHEMSKEPMIVNLISWTPAPCISVRVVWRMVAQEIRVDRPDSKEKRDRPGYDPSTESCCETRYAHNSEKATRK